MNNKKTVFIGSVGSSRIALQTMIEQGIKIDLVCSLDGSVSENVSGYFPLHEIAEQNDIDFIKFKKINDPNIIERIKKIVPNFIFVIGLSQIITNDLLNCATDYCIGFHPTPLPKFRGRAAVPWLILLGEKDLKISLFRMDDGMDSGDLICQYPYKLTDEDYATNAVEKILQAMREGLKQSLPQIYHDSVQFIKQKNEEATYLLIRRPEDGKINWNLPAEKIHTLIRAVSHPYPGAFSYIKGEKITIWRAELYDNLQYIGIPGQIAIIDSDQSLHLVIGNKMLHVTDYDLENKKQILRVGYKLE
jgi:methionyl-tRNA formyltransferase